MLFGCWIECRQGECIVSGVEIHSSQVSLQVKLTWQLIKHLSIASGLLWRCGGEPLHLVSYKKSRCTAAMVSSSEIRGTASGIREPWPEFPTSIALRSKRQFLRFTQLGSISSFRWERGQSQSQRPLKLRAASWGGRVGVLHLLETKIRVLR